MTRQKISSPKIGFDRYIALDWAAAALRARAESGTVDDLNELLDAAGLGVEARKKTRTVLNRLWLQPRPELADFAQRGVDIYKSDPSVPIAALTWGMAIATYPFFGKVAELIGRLSSLQGDCASAEVHRRMSEIYGEREGTLRMTNMVLQSQANWGVIERVEKGKRLIRMAPIRISSEESVTWLVEAVLRYANKAFPVSVLSSQAVIFPFMLDQPLGYLVSKSPNLVVYSQGVNSQFVSLPSFAS
ncbi:hypothetical protein [Halomonas sp. I5-271120]|uniref:hypothetical protein n=1 Tax=Halomonas sp. I5-271120 TaxID=3061632 RepID=UPI002714E4D3|nr:hypothetical protein [Halomonas sp. I5-271120]